MIDYGEYREMAALHPFYFTQEQFDEYKKFNRDVRWMTEEEQKEATKDTTIILVCEES